MKQLFFLSGLARSGSTLIGSILNQNPNIYVSPTSPLMDLFCLTEIDYQKMDQQYTYDKQTVVNNLHKVLASTFYQHIDKPYVMDKHRGWPKNINQIKQYITDSPKIICTYRPIAEIICSFIKLMDSDPNNVIDKTLRERGLEINRYNRAMLLWYEYATDPYESLKYGLENHRENILVISYDDIVNDVENQLVRIYGFLEIPEYTHTFDNISNTCNEAKDTAWGFEGLHDIRSSISKTSNDPKTVLGKDLYEFFVKQDNQLMLIE
jgi:sulfotransferase